MFDPTVELLSATVNLLEPETPLPGIDYVWRRLPDMLVDRWYPTVTALPDGRLLLTSGNSQDPDLDGNTADGGQTTRIIEIYNPFEERWERTCSSDHGVVGALECTTDADCAGAPGTTCNSTVPSFPLVGWPSYPFIYVLPDGNVFYGGGETPEPTAGGVPAAELSRGRVLLSDTNNGSWAWHPEQFESNVTGGSSVMYRPGTILKSGGPAISGSNIVGNATADAEVIDFSGLEQTDGSEYAGINQFEQDTPAMGNPRHFHNLVTMPSGRVVAVSGNTYGNSDANVDDFDYGCSFGNTPIAEMSCSDGCPTLCHDPPNGSPSHCTLPDAALPTCSDDDDCNTCDGAGLTTCDPGNPGASCGAGEACAAGRCADPDAPCAADADCDEPAGELCIRGLCSDPTASCSDDDDCGGDLICARGQICEAGHCIGFCSSSLDCPDPTQVCREVEQSLHGNTVVRRMCLDACSTNADCAENDHCIGSGAGASCDPANNECFFVHESEVFTPGECSSWTDLGANQEVERMYHATAFLLPDGGVLSTAGGGRTGLESNYNAEVLRLHPAPSGALTSEQTPEAEAERPQPAATVGYGDTLTVFHDDVAAIDSLALIRLASTTHGFDQDSRRIPLQMPTVAPAVPPMGSFGLTIPTSYGNFHMRNSAPPGPYMLFALDSSGVPLADALYVNICDPENPGMTGCGVDSFTCELAPAFTATASACSVEPIGGVCPSADRTTVDLPLPHTQTASGTTVPGWTIVTRPGTLHGDPANLTGRDLDAVAGLCQRACEREWGAGAADCSSPNTLLAPVHRSASGRRVTSRVHPDLRNGDGLFPNATLPCQLGGDCVEYFDEALGWLQDDNGLDANARPGQGEEYRTEVGSSSYAYVESGTSSTTVSMTGKAGYSFCDQEGSHCPFYFGSLDAAMASSSETLALECADGSTDTKTLSGLTIELVQPAWGFEYAGYSDMKFSPGAVLLEVSGTIDGVPFSVTRPNQEVVTFAAQRSTPDFFQVRVDLNLHGIPCGTNSTADAYVHLKLREIAAYLDSPPDVSITTPTSVACDGTTRTSLGATVSDPDGDLTATRWFVDGIRIDPAYSALIFTSAPTLRVEAEDARGAVSSDERNISCAP